MNCIIERALRKPGALGHDGIVVLLSLEETDELFRAAYQVKCRHIGKFEITLQR